jgi:hypothetical protein
MGDARGAALKLLTVTPSRGSSFRVLRLLVVPTTTTSNWQLQLPGLRLSTHNKPQMSKRKTRGSPEAPPSPSPLTYSAAELSAGPLRGLEAALAESKRVILDASSGAPSHSALSHFLGAMQSSIMAAVTEEISAATAARPDAPPVEVLDKLLAQNVLQLEASVGGLGKTVKQTRQRVSASPRAAELAPRITVP